MKKAQRKAVSFFTAVLMILLSVQNFNIVFAAENVKQMEYLNRGLTAIRTDGGIYLSWRLLGTEPLDQKYDIYRDGIKIATVDAVNYVDNGGFSYNTYNVVPQGGTPKAYEEAEVWQSNYIDIPLERPQGGTTKTGETYTYSVNDTSVGDVDGDGEYEYIIKWDPSNSKDNSAHGYTGNVLLDCYKMDGTKLWRIDLGINIRAGAHYTQFMVYDFDGDGKAEMALRTTLGSKDGLGRYVSEAGSGLDFQGFDNTSDLRQGGSKSGHIIKGPDWLTMFNGETGAAMQTIEYYPQRGSVSSWGDSYGGRSERYLAGVAYLNGTTPSLIMCRGYYEKAAMAAYNWDGEKFTKLWGNTYTSKSSTSLYGQGTHSLSVADVDNDGYDEIIFGSAIMDHNGNVLNSTGHGHGDALHVSDFNNDGEQEVMMVHEDKSSYRTWGAELRKGKNASIMAAVPASADVGRGVMANIDDEYAKTHSNALSVFYSVADDKLYDLNGNPIQKERTVSADGTQTTETIDVVQPAEKNFFIYWDGDLGRELLDRNRIVKYTIGSDEEDVRSDRLETFTGIHTNNSSKETPAISADLFGDWREEVAFGTDDNNALRIYTTVTPTDYKLTTLMHDSQYRCAIAWQNTAYNQPPHQSYYIGSASLASGKNYLDPATGFDKIEFAAEPEIETVVQDIEEKLIYTVDSFDNENDFVGGSISTIEAPYNNALSVSSSSTLDFGFVSSTPDPNATPTPVPTASPTPPPEPKPIPEEEPSYIYNNNFNDLTQEVLVHVSSAVNVYEGIDGLTLVTGNRSSDGSSTNWEIGAGGTSGNALVMNSGKYCNTRGPRIAFDTPQINSGESAELNVKVKLYSNGSDPATIRYNDNIDDVNNATDISSYFSTSAYKTFKVIIENNNNKYTRTLYSDDEVIASDSNSKFPVLLGILSSGTDYTYTGIYFDDFTVEVHEPKAAVLEAHNLAINNNAASADIYNTTDSSHNVRLMAAAYNSNGSLNEIKSSEILLPSGNYVHLATDQISIPEGGNIKAFIWDMDTQQAIDIVQTQVQSSSAAQQFMAGAVTDEVLDSNGSYKLSFDWRPGSKVEILNEDDDNIISLTKTSAGAIKYLSGNDVEGTISTAFTDSSHWYHAEITFDFTAKTADISLMDYTANSAVKEVFSVSFSSVNGFISKLKVTGSSYLDNLTINSLKYNVDMSLINVNVKDADNSPVSGASVAIGTKKLETDASGHCAIKLKSGEYNYTVTKPEYKSAKGSIIAQNNQNVDVNAQLLPGEMRNIYVSYVFGQDVEVSDAVLIGTAKENTTYTLPDSAKTDVEYTFPTDTEDIPPGYEEYAGQTHVFEYDPNNSRTVDVQVEENADTYIKLAYVIKRVPVAPDEEIVRVHMSEDGVGRSYWTSNAYEFVENEETGIKYTQFTNIAANPVTVNIPNTSANFVMEYDIMFNEISWGGDYVGMIPYSGSSAGQSFGLRSSSQTNNQWQWAYRSGGDKYLQRTDAAVDKYYSASEIWKNKWAHVIVVCNGSELRVTAALKDTGFVIIQDQPVPLANNVGTASRPINKVVFTRVTAGAGGEASIGISNFKAYTVGAPQSGNVAQSTVDIKPEDKKSFASGEHISDVEGVNFDASDIIGATYEIQDESGETVTPEGFAINSDGELTVNLETLEGVPQYYVVVKYNGVEAKKITLNYLKKTLVYGTIKGFDSGTDPFSLTSASGFSISNSNGTLYFNRTAGTAKNDSVFLTANIWSNSLSDEFVFSYDYKVDDAFYKGYWYLQDGSGNNLVKGETHFDEPRIKFFTPLVTSSTTATFGSPDFVKGQWYTFVYRSKNMLNSEAQITLDIYNKGEYTYQTDQASAEPIISIPFTPSSNNGKGLVLKMQMAQNPGKQTTDNGDAQYFDNLAYYYYDYQ